MAEHEGGLGLPAETPPLCGRPVLLPLTPRCPSWGLLPADAQRLGGRAGRHGPWGVAVWRPHTCGCLSFSPQPSGRRGLRLLGGHTELREGSGAPGCSSPLRTPVPVTSGRSGPDHTPPGDTPPSGGGGTHLAFSAASPAPCAVPRARLPFPRDDRADNTQLHGRLEGPLHRRRAAGCFPPFKRLNPGGHAQRRGGQGGTSARGRRDRPASARRDL